MKYTDLNDKQFLTFKIDRDLQESIGTSGDRRMDGRTRGCRRPVCERHYNQCRRCAIPETDGGDIGCKDCYEVHLAFCIPPATPATTRTTTTMTTVATTTTSTTATTPITTTTRRTTPTAAHDEYAATTTTTMIDDDGASYR